MSTLSNGTTTIAPTAIDEYESASEAGTIVDQIVGSDDVAVTLRPAGLRTGSMSLVIGTDETASVNAEAALRTATIWTVNTAGVRASIDMTFVVVGSIARILDKSTGVWSIAFGWQEVRP